MPLLRLIVAAFLPALLTGCLATERRGPVVYAASSLQRPLEALAARWVAQGGDPPVLSFASSAALASRIEKGAPADIFVSADRQWTDYIVAVGTVPEAAIADVAANGLVVARSLRKGPLGQTGRDAGISALRNADRIVTGDPDTVPLGGYAREAIEQMELWDSVRPRLIKAASSAEAVKLLLLGDADIGLLYASDVARRPDLGAIYRFPASSHRAIAYRAIKLPGSAHPDADAFLAALTDDGARAIFKQHGFALP